LALYLSGSGSGFGVGVLLLATFGLYVLWRRRIPGKRGTFDFDRSIEIFIDCMCLLE